MKLIKYPLSLVYFLFSIFLVSAVSYSADSHSEATTDNSAPAIAPEGAERIII